MRPPPTGRLVAGHHWLLEGGGASSPYQRPMKHLSSLHAKQEKVLGEHGVPHPDCWMTSRLQATSEPPAANCTRSGYKGPGEPLEPETRPPAPPTSSRRPMGASTKVSSDWLAAWHANKP